MAQDFDVSLKLLFRRSNGIVLHHVLKEPAVEWLNVELPRVRNPRVDMLVRTESGELVHLDLQSGNDSDMPRREAEYYLDLYRLMGQHVRQVVLYVGPEPLSMSPRFQTPAMDFCYELVDIREFDGAMLLDSEDLGDCMLALLTRSDKEAVGRRVWPEIEKMPPSQREDAISLFLLISGLRGLEDWVLERVRTLMPLSIDVILNNKVLGPAFRRHIEEGEQKGVEKGLKQGRQEGEVLMLRRFLESRFGPLPAQHALHLKGASEERLSSIADRALTAATLEEVFSES